MSLIRPGGAPLLDRVSLTVRAGEVVGIAGVDGNGQEPLVRTLLGLESPDAGQVQVSAPLARLGVIPADRQREALVLPLSLSGNLLLKRYREEPFSRHGWLSHGAWEAHARKLMAAFDIRAAGPEVAVAALSGGNQQKAVIGRELHVDPGAIIAVNPTRGLDVGAAGEVLHRLVTARDNGAAVLLVHSDLDELLTISDRVLVMHGGRLVDSGWPTTDRDHIGRLMLGAT